MVLCSIERALGPATEPLRGQMRAGQMKGLNLNMTELPFTPEVFANYLLSVHQPPPTNAHECSMPDLVPLEAFPAKPPGKVCN